MLFFCSIAFIFGLSIGSFLNSIVFRLERGETFLKGRSYCPSCRHELSWRDLIPLFSFLFLWAKCRYCAAKISFRYPLIELATGILFASIFQLTINSQQLTALSLLNFCYLLIVSCFLIIIFVYDLKHYIIPDGAVFSAIGIVFLYNFIYSFFVVHSSYFFIQTLLSAAGASAFFLLIILFSGGKWMGLGDAKLAFFMGLFLGYPNILAALFLAFFAGAIMGVALIISGKKEMKSEVPFGPFLIIGTIFALFWGNDLVSWYLNLLVL